jgi:ATP-dependent RNA helicase RhlE
MLKTPVTINQQRVATPAVGITQAVYPVGESLKASLFLELIKRGEIKDVIVFTRTKHRSNRLFDFLTKNGIKCERIHGNRSQAQRTQALAGFKNGSVQVLVATDIVARGIDVEELGHVVNFDVPHVPEDYIHRVGRTARAEATGDAFTFVSPEEETDLRAIERAVGKRLPRVTLPGFDYASKPAERFEVPVAERIAEIRKRKAEERARAKEKADRKAQREAGGQSAAPARSSRPAGPSGRAPARDGRGAGASSGPARPSQPRSAGPSGPSRDGGPYASERTASSGGGPRAGGSARSGGGSGGARRGGGGERGGR